jgi:hypothetical protein
MSPIISERRRALGRALIAVAAVAIAGLWVQPAAAQRVVRGDCSLRVDGKTYINVKKSCRIDIPQDERSFTINMVDENVTAPNFAYVILAGDGTAGVAWNGHPGMLEPRAILGDDFRRRGNCWVNFRAEVCAQKR